MFDAKTATPEQVSQLIAEMKEAKNKAFMLVSVPDEYRERIVQDFFLFQDK